MKTRAIEQEEKGRVDTLRHLRRLQSFRQCNACALIALPYSAPLPHSTRAARGSPSSLGEEDSITTRTEYRLNHLTCALTPKVSCYGLDYTRPGFPSDAPPIMAVAETATSISNKDCTDDSIPTDVLRTRLVIPNTTPTSIRSIDHHRCCMVRAKSEIGEIAGDSLSIAHQRRGPAASPPAAAAVAVAVTRWC